MTLFLTLLLLVAASAAAWWKVHARALRSAAPARPMTRRSAGGTVARTAPPGALIEDTGKLDAKPARMRDRYIAARFPGVLRGSADLREIEYVIKVARHYFEEGRLENAAELFALAIEQTPSEPTLRLAQLEIVYLARDAGLFTQLARELWAAIPALPEWAEVVRLGHAIAPGEALFGTGDAVGTTGQYGPWPDMPNWIQASWDLTSEVLAADFHHTMASVAEAGQRPALRRVA